MARSKYIITFKLVRETGLPCNPYMETDECVELVREDIFVTYAASEKQAINNLRFRGTKEYTKYLGYDTREIYYIDQIKCVIN